MKKRVISMITACLLSAAAMAPSFAEDGAAAAARAAGPSDVRGESLYPYFKGREGRSAVAAGQACAADAAAGKGAAFCHGGEGSEGASGPV